MKGLSCSPFTVVRSLELREQAAGAFTSHTINATLYPKLPYDPVADFTPISMIATVPSLLVGPPKLPAPDLASLIALAKAKPGTLSIAIGGIGSSLHLAGEQLKMIAGIDLLNVPYKGTAPALTDLLGGQVDVIFISLVTGAAQVRAGKLRGYGVTSAQRQPSFPDLPAIGEIVKASNRPHGLVCSRRRNSRRRSPVGSMRRSAGPLMIPSCAHSSRARAPRPPE